MDDSMFEAQCEETLKINYFGVKKVINAFNQMILKACLYILHYSYDVGVGER